MKSNLTDVPKTGDWVEVRSASEIAKTLNAEGTLGGLPFMPEMLPYCGRIFRVERRACKACFEVRQSVFGIAGFRDQDLIVLENLRCSGASHGKCQRMCTLFWKAAWLKKVEGPDTANLQQARDSSSSSISSLKTKSSPDRYFCQSTELQKITSPMTSRNVLEKCVEDLRSGSRGFWEMLRLVAGPAWRKLTYRIPRNKLAGNLKRTPVSDLNLQPGEMVHIKTAEEIRKTLDNKGRTRGLSCDYGMCNFRGPAYRVAGRLDRMISEPTGEMREVQGTVILDGLLCTCINVLGGCPRKEPIYWRESWLERAEPKKDVDSKSAITPS